MEKEYSQAIQQQPPVIEVRNVHKSFRTVHAVRGIDLQIGPGQFVAILGPNGAGKTTLVEMIEGIQKPDRGEILILGKNWKGNGEELHRMIGLSLQETRFTEKLTVFETLRLFASFFKLDRQRIEAIIALTGLEEKRKSYVGNLSGGQRQRLALGIALLNSPRILLLDEPTTGLDPAARREIWSILMALKRQSATSLILTTHYMEEAEYLCDRIIIVHHGQILEQGTLSQLLDEDSDTGNVLAFDVENLSAVSVAALQQAPFRVQWNEDKGQGLLFVQQIEAELPAFLEYLKASGITLKSIQSRKKTLDDLFISLTGQHLDA